MVSESYPVELAQLAGMKGVEIEHRDGLGAIRRASAEALVEVLRSLGVRLTSPEGAGEALEACEADRWRRAIEPVHVAWGGRLDSICLRTPEGSEDGCALFELSLEDGRSRKWSVELVGAAVELTAEVKGRRRIARRVGGMSELPPGYHRLTVEIGGAEYCSLVISAPKRTWDGDESVAGGSLRSWGVFMPLHALRTDRDWGVGDLTDLRSLGDWSASLGAGAVCVLPMLASFHDERPSPSPYAPVSRLFWDELYLDPTAAPEFHRCKDARRLVASEEFALRRKALTAETLLSHSDVMKHKRPVLELLSRSCFTSAQRVKELESWIAHKPEVEQYACFRAAVDAHHKTHGDMPDNVRGWDVADGSFSEADHKYHLYCQFLLVEQLAGAKAALERSGSSLFLDLPVGTHPRGYDVWRFADQFAQGATIGAPPDELFTAGQNWGCPPTVPEQSRLAGHDYFIASVREQLRYASLLRIDHAQGLHRLLWIPDGFDAAQGVYVRNPAQELHAILCLESHRAKARIACECLGAAPPEAERDIASHGMARLFVAQLHMHDDPRQPMSAPNGDAVASLNTHDTATFKGFLSGADLDDRASLGLLDGDALEKAMSARSRTVDALRKALRSRGLIGSRRPSDGEMLEASLIMLAESDAQWMLVSLEDLCGHEHPQNVPGTLHERPNWRRRAVLALAQLSSDEKALLMLKLLNEARQATQSDDLPLALVP